MTECCTMANLQCVVSSGLRNPGGAVVTNPLGWSSWKHVRLLSGRIQLKPFDWTMKSRLGCVASSSQSPQEPMRGSIETEEAEALFDGVGAAAGPLQGDDAKSAWESAMEFVSAVTSDPSRNVTKRKRSRMGERKVYQLAAIASSIGFVTMAAGAVYYRFYWQMQGSTVPYAEILGTFSLAIGAAVGMEYWARWAHRALWHDSLWNMHESHHKPREGPFEMNDVFAIINAVPAISLMAYGFFNTGLVPGLCFGAGLGITMFGMAYMFVHDGLVHRRFPVGPIADVPYLQKVAAAHQLHHADLFGGVPYGLFLGPQELENVGGEAELEKLLKSKSKSRKE